MAASDTTERFTTPAGGFERTFTARLNVIGPGDAKSFLGHILIHLTVTPEGTPTAFIQIVDIECK